jgi:hypothetical protein
MDVLVGAPGISVIVLVYRVCRLESVYPYHTTYQRLIGFGHPAAHEVYDLLPDILVEYPAE